MGPSSDKPKQNQLSASTWIPLGVAASIGVGVVGVALTLGADRATVTRQVSENTRCLERHEAEIKELRQKINDDIGAIRSTLSRIEGKMDRQP